MDTKIKFKQTFKVGIIFLTMLTGIEVVNCQQDTITYSIENSYDSIDCKYNHIYNLFVADKVKDTKQLWKTNLLDISTFFPSIVYERKLGNNFSTESYLRVGIFDLYNKDIPITGQFSSHGKFEQSFKYYYNLKRRERLGKRYTGFSGNYFAISGHVEALRGSYRFNSDSLYEAYRLNRGVLLKYGLQRRLGNIGYIEPSIGFGYNWKNIKTQMASEIWYKDYKEEFLFNASIQIGFAIDSFRSLKRIKN